MKTLNVWEKGGICRVYVNNATHSGFGDKVWVEQKDKDSFGCDWKIKTKLSYQSSINRELECEAEDFITQTIGHWSKVSFQDILDAAK